jgi:predicted short-subunit dehydrogenase-like oxidoreductase (DUF2520 family)
MRAIDVFDFQVAGRKMAGWRVLWRSLVSLVLMAPSGGAAFDVVVRRRDSGALVGVVEAGDNHYIAASLRDLLTQRARELSPDEFVALYKFY